MRKQLQAERSKALFCAAHVSGRGCAKGEACAFPHHEPEQVAEIKRAKKAAKALAASGGGSAQRRTRSADK